MRQAYITSTCVILGMCWAVALPKGYSGPGLAMETPLTYRVEKSGILFYVESNRQHVAALDKNGKVIWHKNVIDQVLTKESLGKPARVVWIGKPHDWMLEVMQERGKRGEYISITLSTKEFGVLDQSTGMFTSMGND